MLIAIAAVSINNVIGDSHKQLWRLLPDLKRFKELTMGHSVIFGRKTFEQINHPLAGRNVIIFSRKNVPNIPQDDEVFVAGGGEIYKLLLPLCQKMYITSIDKKFNGDVYFPEITSDWQLIEKSKPTIDPKSKLKYHFETWHREP